MTIEGIGAVDPIGKEVKIRKNHEAQSPKQASDAVEFSSESRIKGEFHLAKEQVHNTPDVRADIIARAKEKINDPAYLNDPAVIDTVARRIVDMLLG